MSPAPPPKVITRHRDGLIYTYVIDPDAFGTLEPAAVFHPQAGDEAVASVVRPDLGRVVYTSLRRVVCLTRAGDLVWASAFEPHSDERYGRQPGCALSLDGRTVWVYRPDAMAGRGGADQWVVHDAYHRVHPVDGSIYLDIGEGQDGSVILRGIAGADGEPQFVTYPWDDRCLIDLAPGGQQFMTVDHAQADVAFHHHPSGDVHFTLPVDAFGYDAEDTFVEWSGGYLTPDTAIVTVGGGDQDEEEWFRHYLIDVCTGTVAGEFAVEVTNPYELQPLGDGSWLTADSDGHPVRKSNASPPSAP